MTWHYTVCTSAGTVTAHSTLALHSVHECRHSYSSWHIGTTQCARVQAQLQLMAHWHYTVCMSAGTATAHGTLALHSVHECRHSYSSWHIGTKQRARVQAQLQLMAHWHYPVCTSAGTATAYGTLTLHSVHDCRHSYSL